MARKAVAAILTAGAAAGAALGRRSRRPGEHVDVYASDGSMVSFAPGSPAGDRLLPLARRVLAAARG
ncbi:MAG: hypothetical protein WD805_05450 [Gaiellaceae bacterium]